MRKKKPGREAKNKRICFSVNADIFDAWIDVSDKLLKRNIVRSKVELFESLVCFLKNSNCKTILKFRASNLTTVKFRGKNAKSTK